MAQRLMKIATLTLVVVLLGFCPLCCEFEVLFLFFLSLACGHFNNVCHTQPTSLPFLHNSSYPNCSSDFPAASFVESIVCRKGDVDLVYFHIFKTGGTRAREIFENLCTDRGYLAVQWSPSDVFLTSFPSRCRFAFTTIRDPVARFLSGFHELRIRMDFPPLLFLKFFLLLTLLTCFSAN